MSYVKEMQAQKRIVVCGMIFLWFLLMAVAPSLAQAAALTISGTGLNEDVAIGEGDWGRYEAIERFYSVINRGGVRSVWKVRGYDLFSLIGSDNLKTDQDYVVTFTAADGFTQTLRVSELTRNFYSNFTPASAQSVAPMLGFYRREVLRVAADSGLTPPFAWEDSAITEADADQDAPRLFVGQSNVTEVNAQFLARDLVAVQVGEARPEEPAAGGAQEGAGATDGATAEGTEDGNETGALPETSGPSVLYLLGLLLGGCGAVLLKKSRQV